jgi:hypothetical protein
VPSSESPSQCTTNSAEAAHSHALSPFESTYAAAMPIEASTPSAVRWSGFTRLGNRFAPGRRRYTGDSALAMTRRSVANASRSP